MNPGREPNSHARAGPDYTIAPEFSRGLLRAISNTAVSVLYQDMDDAVVWSLNVPAPWRASPFAGESGGGVLSDEAAEQLAAARRTALERGRSQALEVQIKADGGARWFDVWIDADRDQDGEIKGLITTAVETTDHKLREQTLKTLLREVSHRSKNLLAIILSIAGQTGRYSGSIEMFLLRFRGRIQSLASSQDLVTLSNWRGADLRQLAKGQIGRYCESVDRCVRITGPSPYLNPNAALHIGLALHELAVNSVSHGALAQPDGKVELGIGASAGDRPGVEIVWREHRDAGPPPGGKRFGSIALERVVPAALDGSATLELENGRVEYRLFVPATNYEMN